MGAPWNKLGGQGEGGGGQAAAAGAWTKTHTPSCGQTSTPTHMGVRPAPQGLISIAFQFFIHPIALALGRGGHLVDEDEGSEMDGGRAPRLLGGIGTAAPGGPRPLSWVGALPRSGRDTQRHTSVPVGKLRPA